MSDASKALAEVRGWLCGNLGSGDAGKVCGMLSVVSRRINELEDETAKLREQGERLFDKTLELGTENAKLRELAHDALLYGNESLYGETLYKLKEMARELGIEVDE